ncbi:MAG: hypothetical protein K9K32_07660 [Halanaerobiales bacterium]|nr:hypothetical protein [Halanaerobiales bacterium]
MELNDIEAIQKDVEKLYKHDNVIGISDDRIHFKIDRFLEEFDEFEWRRVELDSYHLDTEHNGVKYVAVFNDYDIELLDKVQVEEFKNEILERF